MCGRGRRGLVYKPGRTLAHIADIGTADQGGAKGPKRCFKIEKLTSSTARPNNCTRFAQPFSLEYLMCPVYIHFQ